MPVYCIAPWCNEHHKSRGPNKRFFTLPINDPVKLKQWIDILEVPGRDRFSTAERVCSDHFRNESFMDPNCPQASRLRRDALPTGRRERKAESHSENQNFVPSSIDTSTISTRLSCSDDPPIRALSEVSTNCNLLLENSILPVDNNSSTCTVAEKDGPSDVFRTIPVSTGKRRRTYDFYQSCPFYSLGYSEQKEEIEAFNDENNSDITLRSSFFLRLKSIIFESLQTEAYTDVVFVCGTEKIRAHKLVLSAFSDFLKGLLLETDGEEDTVIILDQFEYVDVFNAIGLLYNGVILLKSSSEAAMVQSVLNELKIKLPMGDSGKHVGDTSKPTRVPSEKTNNVSANDSSEEMCNLTEDEDEDVLEALGKEDSADEAVVITHSARKPRKSMARKNLNLKYQRTAEVASVANQPAFTSQCRFCSETFPDVSVRHEHERTHPDAHQACEICGEVVFIGKRADHMRKHREYICEHCGKVVWNLSKHLRIRHGEEFVCDLCDKKLSNRKRLDLHKEMRHGDRKAYPCELCVICFKTKEELDKHDMDLHSRNKCPVCHLTLTKEQYRHFRRHLLSHAVEEIDTLIQPEKISEELLKCPRCDRQFSRSDYLENHLIGHYWPQWKFECTKCSMPFGLSVLLSRHTVDCIQDKSSKRKHPEYSSTRDRQRIKPSKNVLKNSAGKRYYSCPQCPKTYTSAFRAHIHAQTVHSNKISCGKCWKLFDSKAQCKEHMSIHKDSKIKTPCVLCSKLIRFANMKFHLIAHAKIEVQTLSSPECPRCSREFWKMSHVQNHLLQHYQPQRVIECSHCFLALRNEWDLKTHLPRCEAIIGKKKRIRNRSARKLDVSEEFETLWDCSACHLTFATQEECNIHIELTH